VRIETVFMAGKSPKEELVEDMIAIISHFAGRLYGMRSHKYRKFVRRFKGMIEEE